MNTEHVMSGLAALRDTIALPELFGMVIESLGGQEALAAALGDEVEDEADRHRDRAGRDLDAMRDSDVARLENIQGMAESFCTWLHAKGEAQMKRDDDAAVDKIRQLSGSFNKAARAVRLSMVLKHEVAGLRPLPQARPGIGAANQNSPGASSGKRGAPGHDGSGERREADDWTEDELDEAKDEFGLYMLALLDAFEQDAANASPEIQAAVKRESPTVVLTRIAARVPHPNLDRRIADIHMGRLWDALKPRNAIKPDALAPPDWDTVSRRRWNDEDHRKWRAERAARRR